jgi:hypothetical protein
MKKALLTAMLAFAWSLSAIHAHAQMVIIASPELKIDSISKEEIHDIFTGVSADLRSGTRIKPVLLKKGPAHDEFLSTFIGVKAAQFRPDWMGLLFAGKMLLPPTLDSEAEVVDYVGHHPASLGYIHKATPHKNVVILTVR